MSRLLIFALTLALSSPVVAQATPSNSQVEPTRIEIDAEKGEILFFVNGTLQATITEKGLRVEESIESRGPYTSLGHASPIDRPASADESVVPDAD